MMVHDEFGQGSAEGGFTKQDELRKALLLDRSHPALREGIQIRAARWKCQTTDAV